VTHNTVERDVSQKIPAKNNARKTHTQLTSNINVSGRLIHQLAKLMMLELTLKKNAMMHAKLHHSPNATSRTTNALDAKLVKIHYACTLWITARSCKKEENASHKLFKDSSE